ncbi:MAG: class I SAM-dependent methyltransferase [bacterium]
MTDEKITSTERAQKEHYDNVHSEYALHYSDPTSMMYYRKFIYKPMLGDIDFSGRRVLEAMCGTGQLAGALLDKGAEVTGLDISSEMLEEFKKRWPRCNTICASILNKDIESASFDAVVVAGGLHHLHPHVQKAIDEIHRILKPGGYFCLLEPHAGSLPDTIRRLWYRTDALFEENEHSIDVDKLIADNADRFEFVKTKFMGNIAYLFVLNSMVFRMPLLLKRIYAPLLFLLESFFNTFQGKRLSCMFISQWKKKSDSDNT